MRSRLCGWRHPGPPALPEGRRRCRGQADAGRRAEGALLQQQPVLDGPARRGLDDQEAKVAVLQVYVHDAREYLTTREKELKEALGLRAEDSLDVLQRALLSAGLDASLQQSPTPYQLLRALQRAAGEPGSRVCKSAARTGVAAGLLYASTTAAAAARSGLLSEQPSHTRRA